MKGLIHVLLPVAMVLLCYAENAMQTFAAANAMFIEAMLVKLAIGIILGIIVYICFYAKNVSPIYPAISLILLISAIVCYFTPTGFHRFISLTIAAVFTTIECFLLFKTIKLNKKEKNK